MPPHGLLRQPAPSAEELIGDPRIELLWVGPRADPALVNRVLEAGKFVLLGLPVGTSPGDWQAWNRPRRTGMVNVPFVAALHRWDGRFRTVLDIVRHGDLGQLVDVRRISRQYIPAGLAEREKAPPKVASSNVVSSAASPGDVRIEARVSMLKWFEMLDELLLLVRDRVISVTASASRRPANAEFSAHAGRAVSIEFESGCYASLELNRHSLAPLETGWVLDGANAGFADGKRFQASADFELIDVPVEESCTDQNAFYDSIIATIRQAADFSVTTSSISQVLALQEMIELSLRTGQAVRA